VVAEAVDGPGNCGKGISLPITRLAKTSQEWTPMMIFVVALFLTLLGPSAPAAAQEGHYGRGHERWHAEFYSKLLRPDTKTSCCNLADCRPTEVRTAGDHYEVLKDGRWIKVPLDKIVKITAPDGGAHICAPPSENTTWQPDDVFCIIMPLEM
jgi:hypothetical protein